MQPLGGAPCAGLGGQRPPVLARPPPAPRCLGGPYPRNGRGHHYGDGEHDVGEDGVVVERRVGELQRRECRTKGRRVGRGVCKAGLKEAHGEAAERFGHGPGGGRGGAAAPTFVFVVVAQFSKEKHRSSSTFEGC